MENVGTSNRTVIAWGDESMRSDCSEPLYLLGATVFQKPESTEFDHLVGMKKRGAAKLHWRDLGRAKQTEVMLVISEIPAITTVIVGTPMNPHKQERARRECLQALLPELSAKGVEKLVLESRGEANDRRDIQFIDRLRSNGQIDSLRIRHVKGTDEPRLWLPDQVLGAYGDLLCEDELDDSWKEAWSIMEPKAETHMIDLA